MLAELRMELDTGRKPGMEGKEFGCYQSSNMQGVLMERIDRDYAALLHGQGIKPYSQCVIGRERSEWIVRTLTPEAYQQIIVPLLDGGFTDFNVRQKDMHVKILKKELKTMAKEELLEEFYHCPAEKYICLEFMTPTSFRSDGRYVIMPEMRYIYQSLMNKYSAVTEGMDMYDEETLCQLADNSSIVRYRLRSTSFPLEGVWIPSFQGEIGIKISGTDTMARYARLLARFGEYAGVGIKTAIGMGAVRMREMGSAGSRKGKEKGSAAEEGA